MAGLLFGRSSQLEMMVKILACSRLVTITGPMGIGKSYFVRQLCSQLAYPAAAVASVEFPSGVMAEGCGAGIIYEHPDQLLEILGTGNGESLLILDACETALEESAALAEQAILRCPGTRVLTTSQIPLRIAGEICFELPPLTLPLPDATPEELLESEAGSMFVACAREVQPQLIVNRRSAAAMADICLTLQGMPQLIKMAAMMTSTTPVTSIPSRLSRQPASAAGETEGKQRVNELEYPTIDNSHWPALLDALLSTEQHKLLAAVGLFPGGATSNAIATLVPHRQRNDIIKDLGYLASIAMVNVSGREEARRYSLADPLRAYCSGSSIDNGSFMEDLRCRLVQWGVSSTSGAEEGLVSGDTQKIWLERLDSEKANLHVAIRYAVAGGDCHRASTIAAELWRYWEIRNDLETGRAFLEQIRDSEGFAGIEPLLSLRIYDGLGMISWRQGDYEYSERCLRIALQQANQTAGNAERYIARLHNHLGLALAFSGKPADALVLFEMAAGEAGRYGNHTEAALALANAGLIHAENGNTIEARKVLESALGIEGAGGDVHAVAISWLHLGIVDVLDGQVAAARKRFYHAARELLELGDNRNAAFAVTGYAVACVDGEPRKALLLAGAANAASRHLGTPAPAYWRKKIADALRPAFVRLGNAALASWVEGQTIPLASAVPLMEEWVTGSDRRQAVPVTSNYAPNRGHVASKSKYLQLFGGFRLSDDDGVVDVRGKSRTALAFIGASGGSVHTEQLVEALWPDTDPELSRRRLRNVLMRLRNYAGPVVVRDENRLVLHPSIECDVKKFTQLAHQCISAATHSTQRDITDGIAAVRVYRGDLLPELAYDEWVTGPRERAKRLYIRLLDLLAEEACRQGSPAATGWLEALIAADPYDEDTYMRLAQFLHSRGSTVAALETLERALVQARNLGVAPSAKLLELDAQLRSDT